MQLTANGTSQDLILAWLMQALFIVQQQLDEVIFFCAPLIFLHFLYTSKKNVLLASDLEKKI